MNRKMDRALAARVKASLAGKRGRADRSWAAWVGLLRLAGFGAVLAAIAGVVWVVRQTRRDTEAERASILARVAAESASLQPDDATFVARATAWMARLSLPYEGDVVDPALRAPGALATLLARPAVYVRAPLATAASAPPTQAAESAEASPKDPLLLCLLDPPTARTEKALLAKVRIAYAGGTTMEKATANVRRLHDAAAGLPVLLAPFAARVRQAPDLPALAQLRRELDHAPVAAAKSAVRAELLVVALDEPGEGKGPTELDGERPHDVRVALIDLRASRVLLRARKGVDPSWISPAARAEYAAGLDSCALAFDLRAGL